MSEQKWTVVPDFKGGLKTVFGEEGEIMGLMHKEYRVHGVQFHAEAILTQDGKRLLENFLKL